MLHFTLRVNGGAIGLLTAQRTSPPGQPEPDDVCTYDWAINGSHSGPDGRQATVMGKVEHRYGDGAWNLIARILEEAGYA